MNVSLTPELETWIQERVAAGKYPSADKLIQDAVRLLQDDENPVLPGRPFTQDELRAMMQEALDSGPPRPLDIEKVLDAADRRREALRKRKHA